MSNASKFDFTSWLETKSPGESYDFMDCCGDCLMGQYMTHKGESWSMTRYNDYLLMVLGGSPEVLNSLPQTFGGALDRVRVLEDA
jgi:hypothetical protein